MSAIAVFFVHTATVETFTGAGPTGDTYAAPVDLKGFLDDGVVLVRTAAGEQLVQKSIWFGPLTDAAAFVPESRVTINGQATEVSAVRRRDGGTLGLPSHIEVDLT